MMTAGAYNGEHQTAGYAPSMGMEPALRLLELHGLAAAPGNTLSNTCYQNIILTERSFKKNFHPQSSSSFTSSNLLFLLVFADLFFTSKFRSNVDSFRLRDYLLLSYITLVVKCVINSAHISCCFKNKNHHTNKIPSLSNYLLASCISRNGPNTL